MGHAAEQDRMPHTLSSIKGSFKSNSAKIRRHELFLGMASVVFSVDLLVQLIGLSFEVCRWVVRYAEDRIGRVAVVALGLG